LIHWREFYKIGMAFVGGGNYCYINIAYHFKYLLMRILLYLLTALTFSACHETGTQQEKKDEMKEGVEKIGQDVKETAADAGDYLEEQRKEMKDDLEERRREIDLKMKDLKEDGSEKSQKARRKLGELKEEINVKLADVKNSTASTWESTRKGADTLLKKSDREWTEFKQEFKELFQ
jgi:ElaB/YqjD/DUF883 family membrane-anchored ribosome-binding protein